MGVTQVPEISVGSCDRTMPVIGMGTAAYPTPDPDTTKAAILEAIGAGYRHFDTAFAYGSEKPLGEAIAEALRLGLVKSRDELFITTKLWSSFAEKDMILPAMKMSLSNLRLEYVDMFLIHWPVRLSKEVKKLPAEKREYILPLDMKSVWEAMEECKNLGLTKGIGVSNFSCKKMEELLATAKIPPAVNQVEMNPIWQQKQLREYCNAKGIHITAYSPLGANNTKWGDNRVMECDVLGEIAKARGKTPAQVSLRWLYEQGVSIVTKSFNKQRMRENLDIFSWSLTEEDSERIAQLPQKKGVLFADVIGPYDISLELDAEI
ncbi:D-galacturonate reductase-like [Rhodamnia argentea]|uniref:D-galacturonate reductase-like n=1 Tax=Rhodamnia argentea TaxID=178133 RepID=A0A8B8MV42_9MYRT|nr:D-galacturonate reductase-like [Rhodamnia argentea]XP_048137120.1 D-galacturonate reductase-like [Rhodamnia argentea]